MEYDDMPRGSITWTFKPERNETSLPVHYVVRKGRGYWLPSPRMKLLGLPIEPIRVGRLQRWRPSDIKAFMGEGSWREVAE
jgi:hypothetical protein